MATKTYTQEEIRKLVGTDDLWAVRALLAIYERQTEDEKTNHMTKHENHVGFSGIDAEILTSIAEQAKRHGLSAKQLALVKKRMPKYSRQLYEIAQSKAAPKEN